MSVTSFLPTVDEVVMDDLRQRLLRTRWPDEIDGIGWEQGTSTPVLRSFVDSWAALDDAALHERLRRYEHVRVDVAGTGVHAVVARAERGTGTPVVLLHGWPSSYLQMMPVLPLLTSGEDGVDAVVVSLPGFGFSDRPRTRGTDVGRCAELVVQVMAQLGYDRFVGRGSDLGAGVLQQLALTQPERLLALHLSGTNPYLGDVPSDLSPAERDFVAAAQHWSSTEMAYAMEHASKPQTLAHALNDSPAGLASWVLEKFRRWSDCGGDLDSTYDRTDLLANLTLYWATQTIGSSMRLYWETAHSTTAAWGRVEVPTAMAMSGADMFPTPREWVERSYRVVRWTDLPRGGHFLEWEVPDLLAADLREFCRTLR